MSYVKRALESQRLRKQHKQAQQAAFRAGLAHSLRRHPKEPSWPIHSSYKGNYDAGYLKGLWDAHLIAALTPQFGYDLLGIKKHRPRTVVQPNLFE